MNTHSSNKIRSGSSILPKDLPINRGAAFGVIIITALLAFEIFNYSTTDFALTDLLGELRFAGLRWATILSIAFCGIDFAGIARLFTPESGQNSHNETWYLFGAWLLAATMNAMLTWWGVSLAILNHETLGNAVIGRETLLHAVPVFVAIMVWLIRVLIIGTFSAAGNRLFSIEDQVQPQRVTRSAAQHFSRPAPNPAASPSTLGQRPVQVHATSSRPAASPINRPRPPAASRLSETASNRNSRPSPAMPETPGIPYTSLEPTYQPLFRSADQLDEEIGEPFPSRSRPLSRSL